MIMCPLSNIVASKHIGTRLLKLITLLMFVRSSEQFLTWK